MVGSCSSSLIPPPPPSSPSPPNFALNHCNHPVMSPSPPLRDVGSKMMPQLTSEVRMYPCLPLPFPKGCGQVHTHLMGDLRRGKHKRGPMKWEAHVVCHKMGHDICHGPFVSLSLLDPANATLVIETIKCCCWRWCKSKGGQGVRYMRGDPQIGRPIWCIMENEPQFSSWFFFPISSLVLPHWHPCTQCQPLINTHPHSEWQWGWHHAVAANHIVIESLVQSQSLTSRGLDRDWDWSTKAPIPQKTRLDWSKTTKDCKKLIKTGLDCLLVLTGLNQFETSLSLKIRHIFISNVCWG